MSESNQEAAPGQNDAANRRQHTRFPINQTIGLRLSSGKWVKLWARNISQGGIAVDSEAPADIGHTFLIDMHLSNLSVDYIIRAKAKVVRLYLQSNNTYRIAFQFIEFKDNSEQQLLDYFHARQIDDRYLPTELWF